MLSEKQIKILAFPYTNYTALICDGAVRSGKTSIMTWAFVKWAMDNFSGCKFGICGKTVDSAIKNVVMPFLTMTLAHEKYVLKWHRAEKTLEVSDGKKKNVFEIFGGKDESSYMLIQGRTLAGILLDEVALMPRSFVEQALARCSVEGARFWFSCNPSNPQNWFYTEWIRKKESKNALYLHFMMTDNPSLSAETLARYESLYQGVFYDRYIRGRWVAAEGAIYDMFDESKHVIDKLPVLSGFYYISCDFGIQNANVFLLWRKAQGRNVWVCVKEYRYSGREEKKQKSIKQLIDGMEQRFECGPFKAKVVPDNIIVDPSASALIVELRQRGYTVRKAKNDVLNGISDVQNMLEDSRLLFMSCCKETIKEIPGYRWDEKAAEHGEDKPVKVDDHSCDAIRYFVCTMKLVRRDDDEEEKNEYDYFM